MSAWICGFIGILSSFAIGYFYLGFGPWEVVRGLVASNCGAMLALLVYSKIVRTHWVRTRVFNSPSRTWIMFSSTYFGTTIALTPMLWHWRDFLWLWMPLLLSTGFAILAYGPIQDRIVIRMQREGR